MGTRTHKKPARPHVSVADPVRLLARRHHDAKKLRRPLCTCAKPAELHHCTALPSLGGRPKVSRALPRTQASFFRSNPAALRSSHGLRLILPRRGHLRDLDDSLQAERQRASERERCELELQLRLAILQVQDQLRSIASAPAFWPRPSSCIAAQHFGCMHPSSAANFFGLAHTRAGVRLQRHNRSRSC